MALAYERAAMAKLRFKPKVAEVAGVDAACRYFAALLAVGLLGLAAQLWLSVKDGRWVNPLGACFDPAEPKPTVGGEALAALRQELGRARLLVFEAGTDAPLWSAWNCRGRTLQLEASEVRRSALNFLPSSSRAGVDRPLSVVDNETELMRAFSDRVPREAFAVTWDEIFVSSLGTSPHLNIFAASRLAGPDTSIFVDDCQKPGQAAYVRRWLAQKDARHFDNGRGGVVCRLVGPAASATEPVSGRTGAPSARGGAVPAATVTLAAESASGAAPARKPVGTIAATPQVGVAGTAGAKREEVPPPSPFAVLGLIGLLAIYAVLMSQMRMHAIRSTPGL